MKKNFDLTDSKHKPPQRLNLIKNELKKYFARERAKALPENADYWDFDCRLGAEEASAQKVEAKELKPEMDKLVASGKTKFYVEILARPALKPR